MSSVREPFGGKRVQESKTKEIEYFQQFKLMDLCIREVRMKTEEHFAY